MNCEQKFLNTHIGACYKICRSSQISMDMGFMGFNNLWQKFLQNPFRELRKMCKGFKFQGSTKYMLEQNFFLGIIFQAKTIFRLKIIFQEISCIIIKSLFWSLTRPSLVLSCNDKIYLFISIQQTCYYLKVYNDIRKGQECNNSI